MEKPMTYVNGYIRESRVQGLWHNGRRNLGRPHRGNKRLCHKEQCHRMLDLRSYQWSKGLTDNI
jgi:hypothetical protein